MRGIHIGKRDHVPIVTTDGPGSIASAILHDQHSAWERITRGLGRLARRAEIV